MTEQSPILGPRVHRQAATATWEHVHHWGRGFGGSTTLYVDRHDGGLLRIRYGNEAIEVRPALVAILAEMVAAAAEWTDAADLPVPGAAGEEERRG